MNYNPCRPWLPPGYIKMVDGPYSDSLVSAVAKGKRENWDIKEQLAWIALENLLKSFINDQK